MRGLEAAKEQTPSPEIVPQTSPTIRFLRGAGFPVHKESLKYNFMWFFKMSPIHNMICRGLECYSRSAGRPGILPVPCAGKRRADHR